MTILKKLTLIIILLALGMQFNAHAYNRDIIGTEIIDQISNFTKELNEQNNIPEAKKTAEWLDDRIAIDQFDGYCGPGLRNQDVTDIAKIIATDTTITTKLTDLGQIITKCDQRKILLGNLAIVFGIIALPIIIFAPATAKYYNHKNS